MSKNMALKGGASQNRRACKNGGQPKNSCKFCSDGICNYANILPGSETNSNFSGEHAPRTPSLLCALEQFYPNCCLIAKYSQKINVGETILKW